MAFADPNNTSNPTTNQAILAAWGDIIRDDLVYLAQTKPQCNVYKATAQSISNNSNTNLTFDSERFDIGGMHSTSSNTSRITVPAGEAGKYLIGGHIAFAANGTGGRNVSLLLNGTTIIAASSSQHVGSTTSRLTVVTCWPLIAGDYVELNVFQDSGGSLNTVAAETSFWATWTGV